MKKLIVSTFCVILLFTPAILVIIYNPNHIFSKIYDDLVLDNVNHYLPCEKLPTLEEVDAVVLAHKDTIDNIIKEVSLYYGEQYNILWDKENRIVTDGKFFHVSFGWGPRFGCEDSNKADILIMYPVHADREIIESIINSSTFFGIPYRLMNT